MYELGSSRLFVDDISNQRVIIFDGRILPQGDYFTRLRREFTGVEIDRQHIETTRARVEEVLQTI
jgi:hypothetical protein